MESDSADAEKVIKFLREEMGVKKIRFPNIAVSASSRALKKALNVWCVRPSNTRSPTTVTL
jgi:isocitrate dehydrogenase